MKKATATVIYEDNRIYNLTVHHNQSCISLIRYSKSEDVLKPYQYPTFVDMYKAVLSLLKSNGYYCASYEDFGCTVYDIMWIDLEFPTGISKHLLPKDR